MDDVLALCSGLPSRTFDAGEVLLAEGAPPTTMFVLVTGRVEVRKGQVTVTSVSDPGSFLGEMAALLGTATSADVVAVTPTEVLVLEDPAAAVADDPQLTLAIARLLARRLQAVTSYLGDLRRQYADLDGHLSMMDTVLSELTSMRPREIEAGSERDDVPDY
ncbi:MAG: Crp/Fnr family transcriptional regulator [Nitriliruptoraceae bacterium]